MRIRTRVCSMLLTACLAVSMLSIGAFAEDLEDGALLNMETDTADYTITEITDEPIGASDEAVEEAEEAPVFDAKPVTDEPDTLIVIQNEKTVELTVDGEASLTIDNVNYAAGQKTENEAIATAEVTGEDGIGYQLVAKNPTIESLTKGVGNECELDYYFRVNGNFYRLYAVKINQTDYKLYYYIENGEEVIAEKFDGHSGPCKVNLYTRTNVTTKPAKTTIVFHGVTPGITYLTVGDTHYTIVVKPTLSYVLDFGLTVQVPQNELILPEDATVELVSENATLVDGMITYTPEAVMTAAETVTLKVTYADGNENVISSEAAEQVGSRTVSVVPATTVYYEEGFASYTGSWSGNAGKGNGVQTASAAGSKANYGYDAKYAAEAAGPSNGTQATSSAKSDTATFTFVGTGVEIYANNTTDSGWLMIMVSREDGTVEKLLRVDTHMETAEKATEATDFQAVTAYNVPVTTILDLSYGTHVVTITHLGAYDSETKTYAVKDVALDGFRVFGTLEDQGNAIYKADLEDNPSYTELRDYTLTTLADKNIGDELNSEDYNDQIYKMYEETSLGAVTDCGAVIVSDGIGDMLQDEASNKADDLLNNGPKNEIYLQPGQSLAFSITTAREVQIGLKALNAAVSVNMSNLGDVTITSSTDMFYTVAPQAGSETEKTITVTNKKDSTGILSITLLKVCDEPNLMLGSVQDIDFTQALTDLGLIDAPAAEAPAGSVNPFEDIREGAYYYGPVLWAVENAITAGKDATHFAPAESCTRAQAVTFLYRAAGEPEPTITACDFADVPANAYYNKAVLWAVENGITAGVDATHFAPNATCTRAQIVTFLYRAAGQPATEETDTAFTDVAADAYYRTAVLWAAENGITAGVDATRFAPADTCTRAQIVTFLYRAHS